MYVNLILLYTGIPIQCQRTLSLEAPEMANDCLSVFNLVQTKI